MLMVLVETRKQLKTLIGQILFRPEDETDGSMFPAELTVSEIQTFLQINDDVLTEWLRANDKLIEDDEDPLDLDDNSFEEVFDLCDIETLKEYALDHELSPLVSHFKPGLLYWDIEDHFDARSGGETSRTFQYTTLGELSFEHHMSWYNQMQVDYKDNSELRDRVNSLDV